MRYTAAVAAAFVAGAVASYEPAPPSYEAHPSAEPMPEHEPTYDDYDCEGDKCDDYEEECHDDSYECKSSSSYYHSSMVYHSSSDYVHPKPTETHHEVVYTTDVVSHYETYCPEPTEIVYNKKTYTVTEATTITIEDCPCTVTRPVVTSTVTDCPEHECPVYKPTPVETIKATDTVVYVPVHSGAPVAPVEPKPVAPVEPKPVEPVSPVVPKPVDSKPVAPVEPVAPFPVNSTVPDVPVGTGTGAAVPTPSQFEGAASKVTFSGAGLAAIFAAVVYAL